MSWLRLVVGAVAVVGVIGFVGLAFFGSANAKAYSCDELLATPADASASDGFATTSLGSQHVGAGTNIRYGFCPPTSGSHYNAAGLGPLRPGFYGPDDAAGPGGWVHNLEHGYVVALYRCQDGACPSDDLLQALRSFVADGPPTQSAAACGYRSKVLVARFDDMSAPFALLAWDRALLLDGFDGAAASQLASRWIEQTAPEPRAC
ncbi:MAG: DUF3105 domain-containing protein [Chloroflexota bacterium]